MKYEIELPHPIIAVTPEVFDTIETHMKRIIPDFHIALIQNDGYAIGMAYCGSLSEEHNEKFHLEFTDAINTNRWPENVSHA